MNWADDHAMTRGDGGAGLSGRLCERAAVIGGLDGLAGRQLRIWCFMPARRWRQGQVVAIGRAGAERDGARGDAWREARDRAYAMVGPDRLAGRVLPARYRLAGALIGRCRIACAIRRGRGRLPPDPRDICEPKMFQLAGQCGLEADRRPRCGPISARGQPAVLKPCGHDRAASRRRR